MELKLGWVEVREILEQPKIKDEDIRAGWGKCETHGVKVASFP